MSRRRSPQPADLLSELPPISYVWETPNRRPRRAGVGHPRSGRSPAASRRRCVQSSNASCAEHQR